MSTPFAAVVDAAATVAATSKRNDKKVALAALFSRLDPGEAPVVVGFLVGEARQGRIGVGWAAIRDLDVVAAEASLTVADVDAAIDQLQATTGPGSQAARRRLLEDLFARATAAEADLLGRLFVGEMRTGALAGVVTDAIAVASGAKLATVRRAVMLAGDLGAVAGLALAGGEAALAEVGLEPLRPVLPMLASTAASVAEAVAEVGAASVEWKLDGVRIQLHRHGDEVRAYTRNLNDVTARLPEVVDAARRYPATSFVLDGEVLAAARYFDLLHLDGVDLIDEPLTTRRARLVELVGDHVIPGELTDDPAVAEAVLAEALARGHEGVMVKGATSTYEAGRRGRSWRKVKPVLTLDLVVLGVEWGSGRRQGWLSNIHLGALDPATGQPVMVGKTFKGMTDELLEWQTRRFLELETHRRGHVVWVRPEQVVEIALDSAHVSTRYPGGVALRFARVLRYRPDKAPADADTLDAVRALLPGTHR